MQKIIVYNVKAYDVSTDAEKISKRMMTKEGARTHGLQIIPGTETEIEISQLEAGEQWTAIGFAPSAN